jgi:triacylglycerol lipase
MTVQHIPRGSPPMYFPSGFVLADAKTCAALVDIAYAQYGQWVSAGNPPASNFSWDTPNNGYSYSAPLFSTFIYYDFFGYKNVATEPFGFAAVDANGNAYLVFRGTMLTAADGYADATIDQTSYDIVANYGLVQEGYYYIYQGFDSLISQAVAGLAAARTFRSFFFTGHSLGSALSSLAVPDILANTTVQPARIPVMHYNFASPRVGDPRFADRMNNNGVTTFRVVNTEDAVPDAPPAIWGLSSLYKHIGTPVDFTAQYGSVYNNHSLDIAYIYALANPSDPEGPLPPATLEVARRADTHAVIDARLMRLTRSQRPR